jgi:hypothetical protein
MSDTERLKRKMRKAARLVFNPLSYCAEHGDPITKLGELLQSVIEDDR